MDDFRLSFAQTLSIEQLLALVQQLRSEVAALTARLDQVQAENRELKRENAQLKQQVAQKDCSIAQRRGEVERLKARLFAPKSEKAAGSKAPQKKMPPELEEPSLAGLMKSQTTGKSGVAGKGENGCVSDLPIELVSMARGFCATSQPRGQ